MTFKWINELRAGSVKLWIVLGLALLVACGGGVAAARYLVMDSSTEESAEEAKQEESDEEDKNYEFVPFGSVVVNLEEGRLTRYLKVKISLKLPKESASDMEKLIESGRKSVYTNWLITYLSGLKLEQVKGSNSIRRLRGKIRNGFNEILKRDEDIEIEAVLFEEFNVQ